MNTDIAAPLLSETISSLYAWGVGVVAFVSVAALIFGGYQYLTSLGNAAKTGSAKTTILSAIIGLLIALFSFVGLTTFSSQFTTLNPNLSFYDSTHLSEKKYEDASECNQIGCGAIRVVENGEYRYQCVIGCSNVVSGGASDVVDTGHANGISAVGGQCLKYSLSPDLLCQNNLFCVEFSIDRTFGSENNTSRCQSRICKGAGGACKTGNDCCISTEFEHSCTNEMCTYVAR